MFLDILRFQLESEVDEVYESADGEREIARIGDKWGLQIWGTHIPPVYDELDVPDEGYVMVRLGDKWGYIGGNLKFAAELKEGSLYR